MTEALCQKDPATRAQPTREFLSRKRLHQEEARETAHKKKDGTYIDHGVLHVRPILRTLLRMTGLLAWGERNANQLTLNERTFTFPNLPSALDGLRILHLSDFHFDERPGYVQAVQDLLAGIECDLCVVTGDYRFDVVGPSEFTISATRRVLSQITTRHGMFGVLGNHDYASYADAFRAFGLRILMNENVELTIDGVPLVIAGVDDPHYYRAADVALAAQGVNPDAFSIMLAHSPEVAEQTAAHGFDFYLCGHTHWGQIRLPFFGAPIHGSRAPRKYSKGPWTCGALQGYTTSGLGTTDVPVRYLCPPEALIIELRKG